MREVKKTVEAYVRNDCKVYTTAQELGIPRSTIYNRLNKAIKEGLLPERNKHPKLNEDYLKAKIKSLEAEIRAIKKENVQATHLKNFVYSLTGGDFIEPDWLLNFERNSGKKNVGVPVCPCTDIHYSEVIRPEECMGLNEYNEEIAEYRLKTWAERCLDLLFNHLSGEYPGVVIPLLGDLISGVIHDELTASNESSALVSVQKLVGIMINVIKLFADNFGKVFVPCVPGNHGRTKPGKPLKKTYAVNNFDWHIYCLLQMHFENDLYYKDKVKFVISDGHDLNFKVFNWRYRTTHGMQFRGGDGIIGPIGPIFRGDTRKRAQAMDVVREGQQDIGYDTLMTGHFHITILLRRIMVCGCVVGFSELAFQGPFPYEAPTLPIWLNHPKRGITWGTTVHLDDSSRRPKKSEWVSWETAQ